MLSTVKKVIRFQKRIASHSKDKIESEIRKLMKNKKLPIKEGKLLARKVLHELKTQALVVERHISRELDRELKKAQPYLKEAKKVFRNVEKKASRRVKSAGKKVIGKAKKHAAKVISKIRS
jgi:hypothetical protein